MSVPAYGTGGVRHDARRPGRGVRPGRRAGSWGRGVASADRRVGQARVASASFQVADGRMTEAALAGSGW